MGCHNDFLKISIHTPAKGVTKVVTQLTNSGLNFNPHSREGSDIYPFNACLFAVISIHTPAKGVTEDGIPGADGQDDFNPHSREGSDRAVEIKSWQKTIFQSTLPRRE